MNYARMDPIFLKMAVLLAEASKCKRAKYGSVIVSEDGKRVSIGWNGKPAGSICDDVCFREGLPPNSPKNNCCIHAETNNIINSSVDVRRNGTMYVSGIPCNDCALLIMQSEISRLVYLSDPNPWGHSGSSDDSFWAQYGSKIERVPLSLLGTL